jgi:hypothetical protein
MTKGKMKLSDAGEKNSTFKYDKTLIYYSN